MFNSLIIRFLLISSNMFSLFRLTSSTIVPYINIIGPTGYQFTTVQIQNQHAVHILQKAGTAPIVSYFTPPNMVPINGTLWGNTNNKTARIRTAEFNSQNNSITTSITLAYFTPQLLQISTNYTDSVINIYSNSLNTSITIEEACFGQTAQDIYILVLETKLVGMPLATAYAVHFYNGTQYQNKTYLFEVDPAKSKVDQFFFNNGRLIFLFTSVLQIYSVTNYALMQLLVNLTFSSAAEPDLDVEVSNDLMVFSIKDRLYLYNITARQYILEHIFSKETIHSITKIPQSCFLIVKFSGRISQFDSCIQQQVFSFSLKGNSDQKVNSFGSSSFGIYIDKVGASTNVYNLFNFTSDYPCVQCTCAQTYYYNFSTLSCVKNVSSPQNWSAIDPQTVNLTNFATPVIKTSMDTAPSQQVSQYGGLVDQLIPKEATKVLGTALIVTSMKITPKFFLVFTLFLNDLWYYQYHHKENPEYPNSTKIFMEKVDLIKEFQLNPEALLDYLPFTKQASNTSQIYQNNFELSSYLNLNSTDPEKVYFLFSTEQFYKNGVILAIAYYICVKILHLILFCLQKNGVVFGKMYGWVKTQTRWWTVIVGLVEANGVMFAFCCGLQLKLTASKYFVDKLNLTYMTLTLFGVVLYPISFYLLVRKCQSKKYSRVLLTYSKSIQKSYFFEPLLILGRSFLKSFFHSFLLTSYSVQIILLTVIDIIFTVLAFRTRKLNRNRLTFISLFLYFAGFAVFDLYFVLEYYQTFMLQIDRQLFGFILCCSLGLLSIVLSLAVIYESIRDSFKGLKKLYNKMKLPLKNSQIEKKQQEHAQNGHKNKYILKVVKSKDLKGQKQATKNKTTNPNQIVPSDLDKNRHNQTNDSSKFQTRLNSKKIKSNAQGYNKKEQKHLFSKKETPLAHSNMKDQAPLIVSNRLVVKKGNRKQQLRANKKSIFFQQTDLKELDE